MAEQTPKLQVPKEDIVKKETKALTALTGGLSPKLEDLIGKSSNLKSSREAMPLRGEAVKGQLEAQGREAQVASELPVQQAQLKGDYAQQEAKAYEQADLTRRQQTAENPIPQFNPTQENLMTLATMASLIAVVGNVVGQQGGLSGLSAINSMTGMMKGYQAGRADVFKREQAKFEADLKTLKAKQEQIMKDFDLAVKKIPYDLAEAKADMEVAIARAGSPLLRATYERQGYDAVLKLLDANAKDMAHIEDMAQRLALAQTKKTKEGGALPKDKDTNNQYLARKSVIANINDIESLLKNPKYARLIGPETRFTPDIINNLRESFPELSQKLARIQAIEFEIGGKNLTKAEQSVLAPIYQWKGLTVNALKERIKGVKEDFEDKNAYLEFRYEGLVPLGEKIDNYYLTKGRNPNSVADVGADTGLVATKDDVAVTAASNNISIDEAKKKLKAKGYKIEGEQ